MKEIINKSNFDIKSINLIIENYCKENDISQEYAMKMQLISEEFLFNILFPNFDKDVTFSVSLNDKKIALVFEYNDISFMNKINEQTIYSLKILRKETQEITCDETDNKTVIKFII